MRSVFSRDEDDFFRRFLGVNEFGDPVAYTKRKVRI